MKGPAIPGQDLPARISAAIARMPLFFAALVFAAGILTSRYLWVRPSLLLAALGALALVCAVAASRAVRIATLPLAVLWLMLGAWCGEMEPQPAPDPHLLALSDGLMRTVEGVITDATPLRHQLDEDGRNATAVTTQRIDLQLRSVESVDDQQDGMVPSQGRVRLTLRWKGREPVPLRCGDSIRADARLLVPDTYRDPGSWNRRAFLLESGITATASVPAERIESTGPALNTSVSCMLINAQHTASERLMQLPQITERMPAYFRISMDDAAMLAAMVSGDRTFLNRSLRVGFERTGSFHMLVVSGFHLAIVAGVVLWIARRIGMPQVPATLFTIAASVAFAAFTGFAPPVRRSLFMVTLYLAGRIFYRDRNTLNVIGFAALCLLAVSPRILFEASFQMTLLAVLAIGGIASPLLQTTIHPYLAATRDLRRIVLDAKLPPGIAQFRILLRMLAERFVHLGAGRRAWIVLPSAVRWTLHVCEAIFVSAIIELAMTLPMAIYFHRITAFALPVNVLILPVLLVLLPAAILTLIVLLAWAPAAVIPASFTAFCLHIAVLWIHLFGSLRFGDIRVPTPHTWQIVTFWAGLGVTILLALCPTRRWRRIAWPVLLFSACVPLIPNRMQHPSDALLVEVLDVGQGDAILLITPDGKTLLVDAGGFVNVARPAEQEYDIGEEVVSAALWARGIRHLDAVAISHAHMDHMGGIPAVLRDFHPDELWVGKNPQSLAFSDVLDAAKQAHIIVRSWQQGDRTLLGSVSIDVLAPFADYQPGKAASNNDSLVLRAAFAGTSIELQGDAEGSIEDRIAGSRPATASLLKVGHHGSLTSTQPEFLRAIAPRFAVISCGRHNRFGHPRAEVLEELQSAGVRTFATDIHGASCFRLNSAGVSSASCNTDQ